MCQYKQEGQRAYVGLSVGRWGGSGSRSGRCGEMEMAHARNRARPGVSGPRNKCVRGGFGVRETLLVGSLVVHRAGGIELHGPVS